MRAQVREICANIQGVDVTEIDGPQQTLVNALRLMLEEAADKVSIKKIEVLEETLQDLSSDLLSWSRSVDAEGGEAVATHAQPIRNIFFSLGAVAAGKNSTLDISVEVQDAIQQMETAVVEEDIFQAFTNAARLRGMLQVLSKTALSSTDFANIVAVAKQALTKSSPIVAGQAAGVLIACAQHTLMHSKAFTESKFVPHVELIA